LERVRDTRFSIFSALNNYSNLTVEITIGMIYKRYLYANNDCGGSTHEFFLNVLFKLEAQYLETSNSLGN